METKKIAVVYSGASSWGGIETYLEQLFENVNKSKVDLTLISLGEWPLTKKLLGKKYKIQSYLKKRINILAVFRIASFLRKNKFDLVASQGTVANAYARAASLFSGIKSLVVVHSDSFYDYPNPVARLFYSVIERLTRFPTKHYIVVSEYLKKKLVASGIKTDKISVILNGVKDPGLNARHSSADWNPDGPIVIGSIGRLHKVKNYVALIRACSELKINNWKLVIFGDGSERADLEKLISELGIESKVELRGDVINAREQLEQIDIYVQPSLSEGFGITVIEAMLAGKPVIVSPFGALPELVQNGKTGVVMDSASSQDITKAISDLMSDRDKATQIAKAGQKYARETFGLEKWAQETENVLK